MLFPPVPENEQQRLQALHKLEVLDTPEDERFDWVTRFAAEKLNVPICLITLIDQDRQWFKSTWGVDTKEVPRNLSICAHAICAAKDHYPRGRRDPMSGEPTAGLSGGGGTAVRRGSHQGYLRLLVPDLPL